MREYYAFTWPGKHDAIIEAGTPTDKVLRPDINASKNFHKTQNLYIEGDNLEALKILQRSYMRKVKMIYIDPPYNTGHDFIYSDNFTQNDNEAQQDFGLLDTDDGTRNFSMKNYRENSRTNPRFHSDWCSMIYPRLKLARNLLTDDGVIFISIDDNEVTNLRKICDEIFGESNFVAMFPWQARQSVQNDTDISCNHEYVVAYASNRRQENRRLKETNAASWYKERSFACLPMPLDPDKFANPDNDPRGAWKADPMDAPNVRPNLTYEITNPNTGEKFLPPPGRCWRVEERTYRRWLADGRIIFGKTGTSRPQVKTFYNEKKEFGSVDNTWWNAERCGTATQATKELAQIFGISSPFDTPKPVKLIMQILRLVSRPDADATILDFFAGSSTTAHAVMAMNSQDYGHRKFIMIQLPEECPVQSEAFKAGYANICEIGKERIRRAGEELKQSGSQLTMNYALDTGFRVFKVDSSNMKDVYFSPSELTQDMLSGLEENIKPDRSGIDLLFDVIAEIGLTFSLEYSSEIFNGFTIHSYGHNEVIACFDENVNLELMTEIAKRQPVHAVFCDRCFESSPAKINLTGIFMHYSPDTNIKIL